MSKKETEQKLKILVDVDVKLQYIYLCVGCGKTAGERKTEKDRDLTRIALSFDS
jgi:hypothetical protein